MNTEIVFIFRFYVCMMHLILLIVKKWSAMLQSYKMKMEVSVVINGVRLTQDSLCVQWHV